MCGYLVKLINCKVNIWDCSGNHYVFNSIESAGPNFLHLKNSSFDKRITSEELIGAVSPIQLCEDLEACQSQVTLNPTDTAQTDGTPIFACNPLDDTDKFTVIYRWDEATETGSFERNGVAVVEGVDFVPCVTGGSGDQILCRGWINDVNSDGSVLELYYEAYCLEKNNTGGVDFTSLGFYADKDFTAPYTTPIGIGTLVNEAGTDPVSEMDYILLDPSDVNSPNFYTPTNVCSVSWFVEGPTNPDGTFNFSAGAQYCELDVGGTVIKTIPIPNGHSANWAAQFTLSPNRRIKAGTGRITITTTS